MLENVRLSFNNVINDLLYYRLISLRYDLETQGRCLWRTPRRWRAASLLQCQLNRNSKREFNEYSVFTMFPERI
jgi:hypothetical protein